MITHYDIALALAREWQSGKIAQADRQRLLREAGRRRAIRRRPPVEPATTITEQPSTERPARTAPPTVAACGAGATATAR